MGSIFWSAGIKLPNLKLASIFSVAIIIGVLAIAAMITTDSGEILVMLETPVKDMKLGQVVGLIIFAWVLFN